MSSSDAGPNPCSPTTKPEFPIKKADKALEATAKWGGYDQKERTLLKRTLHRRFVTNLKTLLSHGSLRERLAPFAQRLSAGSDEAAAYNSLFEHADRQRRRFEESPLFNQEPFALADVYVDTDCGRLQWSEIRKSDDQQRGRETRSIDAFSEEHGGRHDLLQTVLGLMKDPTFRDAIVVQGAAGSGKSAFTLRLSRLLIREGLTPLRIRLRDLRLDRPFLKDLAEAALLSQEEEDDSSFSTPRPRDLFLGGEVFKESVHYGGVEICPFVLILDGWDEISVSVEKGFDARVAQMLDQVEKEFLRQRKPLVRVILTGRPSTAVEASKFLGDDTPILTVRPFLPDQLERFLQKIQQALETQRLKGPHIRKWSLGKAERFQPVLEKYRVGFGTGQLEVLGLPLLAHLGLRIISAWKGDLERLVESPTTLYRNLIDLTCKKAGKGPQEEEQDLRRQARFTGSTLRTLLHRTAAAMTAYGEESIPRRELELRLDVETGDLDEELDQADRRHPLTKLMISFYFKGSHSALGCEFLHKSFREFLFAEGIVETLKRYGRQHHRTLAERESYWEDFRETDPRFNLSRELGHMVAPQWLSREVVSHLESLITWEIDRATRTKSTKGPGEQTKRLDLKGWECIRDALADLWDWWGEGVHLRPRQKADEYSGAVDYGPSLVHDLVRAALPRDRRDARSLRPPIRVVTVDAHVGDAICRLAAILHFQLALVRGWIPADEEQWHKLDPKKLWKGVAAPGNLGARKYQVSVVRDDHTFKLFCPFGPEHLDVVLGYSCRINAAGWRPEGLFPSGMNLNGTYLGSPEFYGGTSTEASLSVRRVNLTLLNFYRAKLVAASLANAMAESSIFSQADLRSADFRQANMALSVFYKADLRGAVFDGAFLDSAYLTALTDGATFRSANLRGADLHGLPSSFEKADFTGANLEAVDIRNANLHAARGLTQKQINKAFGSTTTRLPRGLRRPRHWPSKES